ncbi:MAG: DUF3109 family protein [Bacteroidia bacterium]|nr:DUF3109 family protein [Bacteroidia bacterium]MCO5253979.1 DUF3109 family protein [Bacteroidota bacterium]MCZ2128658.1 DUF3109 family protein [Bacteroidia bacterium]
MILIGDKLISDELFDVKFVCNLDKCLGACCVEGDAGAPLDTEELEPIRKNIKNVESYLPEKQKELLAQSGFYEKDYVGELVTTCLPTGECVFSFRDERGILGCALEKAFRDGKSDFKKPISCHLYPIRVSKVGEYTALNYHEWDICKPALKLGDKLGIPVFKFLQDPIIRAFGKEFYNEMEAVYEARKSY